MALGAIIILVGTASFGLGRLSLEKEEKGSRHFSAAGVEALKITDGKGSVVASKSGTAYYPEGCAGANRISPENKVTFSSAKEAEEAGLHKSANCK